MNQPPKIKITPHPNPYLRTESSVRPLEEDDIQELLTILRSVYSKAGEEVPSDEVLKRSLPSTITHVELIDIRSALQKASNPQELATILARRTKQYAHKLQTAQLAKLKAPIQTTQVFLRKYGTELAGVLANTSSKSDFIGANALKRNEILAKAVARWANQKGLDALSIEPILQILREGGVEYLQNVAKAGFEDVANPLKLTPAMVEYLRKLVPSVPTEEEHPDFLHHLQKALSSHFPDYLNTTFVEPTSLTPALKEMASNQIGNAIETADLDPTERIGQAKKVAQEDVWTFGMKKVKATPTVQEVLNPVKEALQSESTDFSTLSQEMEKPVIKAIGKPIVEKTKAPPSLKDLIERSIEIALKPSSMELGNVLVEDPDIPIQEWQKAVTQFEEAYLTEQGYSPKAQAYFQGILAELKSPNFWKQSPEARATKVQSLSRQFLETYVNPKMSRRDLLKGLLPKSADEVLKPAISKEAGETVLTRRAIPAFLSLDGLLKFLGKVPK
ncbi:MAG: hypothetical protein LW809_01295 [Vampirovibrionales bacterium]|jgi:hypothetical protein|nr:hypothetical protein [Vampirovibrionales bacterium]